MLQSARRGLRSPRANFGVSALAGEHGVGPDPAWETAGDLAVAAVDWLLGEPLQNGAQPQRARSRRSMRSVGFAGLSPRVGTVQATLVDMGDQRLKMTLKGTEVELPPNTDSALVSAGYAAVTIIQGVTSADWAPVADHIERRVLKMGKVG